MAATTEATPRRLSLRAEIAADLMMANPVSISESSTYREALLLLTERGVWAAPVIDEAGHPVGVLSGTDLLVHTRHSLDGLTAGVPAERMQNTLARDMMTPAVFSVRPGATAERVVEEMVTLKVSRIFVVDEDGVLIGVISALDLLRRLG
jgi:CBS domain-containing protein